MFRKKKPKIISLSNKTLDKLWARFCVLYPEKIHPWYDTKHYNRFISTNTVFENWLSENGITLVRTPDFSVTIEADPDTYALLLLSIENT